VTFGDAMNIVHVIPAFTKGGGERVAVDLANHAAAHGHRVTFVAAFPVDPGLLLHALREDVDVRYVASAADGSLLRYAKLLPWLLRNRRWLGEQDVVHCHLTFGAAFGAIAWALRRLRRGCRPAIVETYHAVGMPIPRLHRWIHARLLSLRDGIAMMADDPYWRNFVRSRRAIPSALIPNGIEVDRAPVAPEDGRAYRREAGLPLPPALVLGSVGRLVPARRPDLLVETFAAVAEQAGPGVAFLLAGDGPEREAVTSLIAARGLEGRARLPGMVMRPALAFSAIDLYLTVNVGPITGVAALEAAASGLPVIAVQLLDDHEPSGEDWIWSSRDPAAVASEAVRLLEDADARAALAARQSRHVREHFTAEAMALRYEALYSAARAAAAGANPPGSKDMSCP